MSFCVLRQFNLRHFLLTDLLIAAPWHSSASRSHSSPEQTCDPHWAFSFCYWEFWTQKFGKKYDYTKTSLPSINVFGYLDLLEANFMECGHYRSLHGGASEDAYCQKFLEDIETGFNTQKFMINVLDLGSLKSITGQSLHCHSFVCLVLNILLCFTVLFPVSLSP